MTLYDIGFRHLFMDMISMIFSISISLKIVL
jgi:hypothetical protein